jgi:hypothetical protein
VASRKELKNIAGGIIGSFNSRNNDVDGYWGIGKLYSFAIANDTDTVTLDLTNETISPKSTKFDSLIKFYRNMLISQLKARHIPYDFVAKVEVSVKFEQQHQKKFHWWRSALGKPCICTCEIIDDRGGIRRVIAGNNCRPHDSTMESRSTRVKDV